MTIADLIPVIVGAAAGVAGGIGASIHAQYRQSKREIHKELRSNLLAVALESSKIYALIREKESYIIASSAEGFFESAPESMPTQAEPYPVQKIQAIVSLYFPAILDHARELTFAWFHHEIAGTELSEVLDQKNDGEASQKDVDEKVDNLRGELQKVLEKQKQLEEAAQELMSKLLKEKSGNKTPKSHA